MAVRDVGDVSSLESFYAVVAREKRYRTEGRMTSIRFRFELARNYVLAAWRNMVRQPSISTINIVGLGLGIAAVLLIGLFVVQSLSFDQFIPDGDRVMRIALSSPQTDVWRSRASRALAPIIREEWSQAELVTTVEGRRNAEQPFTFNGEDHFLDGIISTDEYFLEMFGHEVKVKGSNVPLVSRGSAVLTESTARKWFGTESPIGKTIRYNSTLDLVVDAVVSDPPVTTHLPFNILVRLLPTTPSMDWRYGGRIYTKLAREADHEAFTNFLAAVSKERSPMGRVPDFRLQTSASIQLDSAVVDDYATVGNRLYLFIFGSIGLLIVILAVANYANMATAQALRRAREVGIRKVVGATRSQLRRQFLSEAIVIASVSVLPAMGVAYIALPRISQLTGQALGFGQVLQPHMIGSLLLLVVIIGFAAGSYPAFLLSRFRPTEIFAGGRASAGRRHRVKRLLVGIQVTISFALIAASTVISDQMEYVRTMNLGFDQEHVVTLETPGWSSAKYVAFAERLEASPNMVSMAPGIPAGIGYQSSSGTMPANDERGEVNISLVHVGPGFFETMRIDLLDGRSFRWEDQTLDPPPVIVTKEWASVFSPDEPMVGKPSNASFGWSAGNVVGIVGDVFNRSVHNQDQVMAFIMQPDNLPMRTLVVRLVGNRIDEGLKELQGVWKEVEPDHVFKYAFLDDRIQQQYAAETRLSGIFGLFSGVSIFIAALGLFGLASLMTQQRRAEIGIRKVLGASVKGIVLLLSREFAVLVVVGALVMAPLVHVYGSRWLDNFAHHAEIGPAVYVWTTVIVFAVVLSAVGIHALRAALANPTDSLRHN